MAARATTKADADPNAEKATPHGSRARGKGSGRRPRPRPVEIEDLFRLRFVADPRISPDGAHVAYVAAWVDREEGEHQEKRYRSQLLFAPADGADAPRPLTSGKHRDWAPRWAPDGRHLAFLSDRDGEQPQLYVCT